MRIPQEGLWRSTGTTLGKGGQGEVQIVTHNNQPDGLKYASKVLRNVGSQQARMRFRCEIEAIKELTSAVIVRVMDYHEGAKTLNRMLVGLAIACSVMVAGCTTQQVTDYYASGQAQRHTDAAVEGSLNALTVVLGTPLLVLAGLGIFVGWKLLSQSKHRASTKNSSRKRHRSGGQRRNPR